MMPDTFSPLQPAIQRKFVFNHIGRTAGSYVHLNLINRFSINDVCPLRELHPTDVLSHDHASLDRYKVYSGHFYTPLLPLLTGNVYAFTVIREPLACFLSSYHHARNNPGPWRNACRTMDAPDAIQRVPHLLANRQTRLLHQFLYHDAHAYEHEYGYCNPGILNRVMDRLDRFGAIGVTEFLQDTFAVLRVHTGLPFNTEIPTHKGRSSGDQLQLSLENAAVHRHLGLDYAIYALVLERLRSAISQLSELGYESPLVDEPSDWSAGKRLSVVFGPGWMQEERNSSGVPSRWSGPTPRSELKIHCPVAFRLRLWANLLAVEQIADLQIFVDGKPQQFTLSEDTAVDGATTRIDLLCSASGVEALRRVVFITSKFASFGTRGGDSLDYTARNFDLVRVVAEPLSAAEAALV